MSDKVDNLVLELAGRGQTAPESVKAKRTTRPRTKSA
jgi:hypothetical protein